MGDDALSTWSAKSAAEVLADVARAVEAIQNQAPSPGWVDLDETPLPPLEDKTLRLYGGGLGGGKSRAVHLMLAAAAAGPNFSVLPARMPPGAPSYTIMDEAVYELPSTRGLTGKSLRRAEKKARRLARSLF